MMRCRNLARYLAACRSCLYHVSGNLECQCRKQIRYTFDPEIGERRAVRNELSFDAISFERISSLCIWGWGSWFSERATDD
jgi:hypothetical protein